MRETNEIHLEANGLRFVALEAGDGPLVLCLHGFPDHPGTFRQQISPLVEAGYRVVAPYMRGYAPTQAPADGNYQSAVLARDVLGLLDALGADRAVVFGHDWGAIAAYGAAIRAPERFTKLVTAAVPYGPAFITAFLSSYAQLKRSWYIYFFQAAQAEAAVAADDFAFLRRLWEDWSPSWDIPDEEFEAVRDVFRRPGTLEAALAYYRCMLDPARQDPALADEQAAQHLVPIEVPTLYFHGLDDGCMGAEMAAGMDAVFPAGLRSVMVEGAGHFLHQEKPEVVNATLLEFLAD